MELRMSWVGHVACMGKSRGACGVLVGKLEGKRPLARTWHSWENNAEMVLKVIRWEGMEWIGLSWGSGKRLADVITLTLSRLTTYIYDVPHS
jgi:hypothetical protein